MLIKTLPVGQLETNCYVVTDENALVCAVIDPGDESNTILDYIEDNKLSCKAILITHAHFDHVSAVNAMLEATGAELYMCEKDLELAKTGASGRFTPPENTHFYKDGDEVKVDFDTGLIENLTTGKTYQAEPFPPFIQNIIEKGGLLNAIKDRL